MQATDVRTGTPPALASGLRVPPSPASEGVGGGGSGDA